MSREDAPGAEAAQVGASNGSSMSRRTVCYVAIAVLAVYPLGCRSGLPERPSTVARNRVLIALADYKENLELTVEPSVTEFLPNQKVSLRLIVRNIGKKLVSACAGEGTVIHLWGIDERYAKILHFDLVDHPFCQESITLNPGERFVRQVVVAIPAVRPGQAKFMASFMVLDPRDCDRYGCYDLRLSSSSLPVHVRSVAP